MMRRPSKTTSRTTLRLSLVLGATALSGCGVEPLETPDAPAPALETPARMTQALSAEYGGHGYYFSETTKTWTEARADCLARGYDGLVTLNGREEEAWVRSRFDPATQWWLGYNDRAVEGRWVWDWNTLPSVYTANWNTGEPNGGTTESCAAFVGTTGGWNDLPCGVTRLYVCEKELPYAALYNGHEYLFYPQASAATATTAQQLCESQGYSLVTINDSAEDEWLKQQVPAGRSSFIGYTSRFTGGWTWPADGSDYTNWRPGEPNNTGGFEQCAVNNASATSSGPAGRWNDVPCNGLTPFICERNSPTSFLGFDFSVSDTDSATRFTADQPVQLRAGQLLTVGTCGVPGAATQSDTYLRLMGPDGLEVAANDDACKGSGSLIRYRVPACGAGTYFIRAGCFEAGGCSGRVGYGY